MCPREQQEDSSAADGADNALASNNTSVAYMRVLKDYSLLME